MTKETCSYAILLHTHVYINAKSHPGIHSGSFDFEEPAKSMVDPVEVQCSLSCNLLNLFHVLRDCCSNASHPLPSKRLAQELSFEANNKRLKESDPEASEREKSNFRVEDEKALWKMRRRPSKLFIPEPCTAEGFAGDRIEENILTTGEEYIEVKGRGYSLACRKGHKFVMEDGYGAISNINGCSKQVHSYLLLIHFMYSF